MQRGEQGPRDPGSVRTGEFDVGDFAAELIAAPHNHQIGTTLWFANDSVRIFETRLEPGERGAFHVHDRTYFWTVVDPGRGLQRFRDGTWVEREYQLGETRFLLTSPDQSMIHDLENVGATLLRFVTVEFVSLESPE
jgi:beta-alanine degradation protein BauB